MIPKIIHYCWFGRNPLPDSALKCIISWKKYFPDYKIIEWNEDNFDVNIIAYTKDAYEAKKYAFVSDFVRFWVLYNYGGLYFDTDVEVIKEFDDVINEGPFFGIEIDGSLEMNKMPVVNPGLCLGAPKGMEFYKLILDEFRKLNFYMEDGSRNWYSMIPLVSEKLADLGMRPNNDIQKVGDFVLYPSEYFNPLDSATGKLTLTENTRSVHWYMASWQKQSQIVKKSKQYIRRFLRLFK